MLDAEQARYPASESASWCNAGTALGSLRLPMGIVLGIIAPDGVIHYPPALLAAPHAVLSLFAGQRG